MGVSTLHHHFRRMTNMSPLQYQKQLRLLAARRLLLSQDADASTAAISVGYESVSQFHREYKRQFGITPIGDKALSLAAGTGRLLKISVQADTGSPMSAVLIRPTARPYQSRNGTSPLPLHAFKCPVNLLYRDDLALRVNPFLRAEIQHFLGLRNAAGR